MKSEAEVARSARRLSFGGAVVDTSLYEAGFALARPGVSLVETAAPRLAPYRAILAQNAWNFVPEDEFEAALAPYPPSMQLRIRARRRLATFNGRRAETVVCLTEHMAELCAGHLDRAVRCTPVRLPLGPAPAATRPVGLSPDALIVLVPGTITWYKRPRQALEVVAGLTGRPARVELVLAGTDDRSGCLEDLVRALGDQAPATRLVVSTYPGSELRWLYEHAYVTVVPSGLESLGFGLAEALLWSARVVASNIASHREIAERVGRQPVWRSPDGTTGTPDRSELDLDARTTSPPAVDWTAVRAEWSAVGRALGLPERSATHHAREREPVVRGSV